MKYLIRTLALLSGLSLAVACGEDGCGCEPMPTSDGGVTADDDGGTVVGSGLQVTNASARACEALFEVSGDELPKVLFTSSVVGESIPKAPRFALAFTAASDSSLVGQDLVSFSFASGTVPTVTMVRATCFDGSGASLGASALTSVD